MHITTHEEKDYVGSKDFIKINKDKIVDDGKNYIIYYKGVEVAILPKYTWTIRPYENKITKKRKKENMSLDSF
jgi:hypothetical protein